MEKRPRIDKIKAWLDANADWIEAAPNVQLMFDCAGQNVKVRPAWAQQLEDELPKAG